MTLFDAIILAIVQGATEFLPVSSSGHLAICGKLLGLQKTPLEYVVAVHFGTLVAVVAYYRKDIGRILKAIFPFKAQNGQEQKQLAQYRRLLWLLLLGTVPAAVAGLLLEDYVDAALGDIRIVGAALIFTGLVIAGVSRITANHQLADTTWRHAIIAGIAQSVALIPGVSRSGCTIAGGLIAGLSRDWAPNFAFLLSIPAIGGGTAIQIPALINTSGSDNLSIAGSLLGAGIAAVVGYASILLVINSVRRGNLLYFSGYCILVGLVAVAIGFGGIL